MSLPTRAPNVREHAGGRHHGHHHHGWRRSRGHHHRHHHPRAPLLRSLTALVLAVLALPLIFLIVEAATAGARTIAHLMWRTLTAQLLWNTVRLTVAVTVLCAIIGTLAAYAVERTDLPLARLWGALLVIPLAIPDFVVSFGWSSLWPWLSGYRGAVIVMTLAVYPLVYLPVAASLRGADPGQEEIARSLGLSPVRAFFRVTLAQARQAIVGGCLLVTLVMLAEYGAFEILGYQTFTTEIFGEFSTGFDTASACALSVVLVVISLVVTLSERRVGGGRRLARSGPGVTRHHPKRPLGRGTAPTLAALAALVVLALGVPVGSAVYWIVRGGADYLSGVSLGAATAYTAAYSAGAAALATLMALPVATLASRNPRRMHRLLERTSLIVLAIPGLIVALALAYFSEQRLDGFGYQTAPLLILAYAIMFFPLALVGVRASLAQAPKSLEEISRSLGQSNWATWRRVTLPLVAPGLGASFCLVFLSGVTELTATLILIPTGTQTLATQFWAYETNLSYGQAAPFALLMIGLAAVPAYLLERFFDRLPARRTGPVVPRVS